MNLIDLKFKQLKKKKQQAEQKSIFKQLLKVENKLHRRKQIVENKFLLHQY